MTTANAWHHHERVYLQAHFDDLVLVQYVDRRPVFMDKAYAGRNHPIQQWAWLPKDDVMPFSDLDATLLKIWKVA